MNARLAEARTWDGLRQAHFARTTGTLVAVLDAVAAGIEDDPQTPWATLCDDHGGCVLHYTLADARHHAAAPEGWCEGCKAQLGLTAPSPAGGQQ